jgi:hypothetical protein
MTLIRAEVLNVAESPMVVIATAAEQRPSACGRNGAVG